MNKQSEELGLQNALSMLMGLHWLYYMLHWQSSGTQGYQKHLLFERLYGFLMKEIDGLAEKMVAMDGSAAVDVAVTIPKALAYLKEWTGGGPIECALRAEKDLQAGLKTLCGTYTAEKNLGLNNYLAGLADTHETAIYLLGQYAADTAEEKKATAAYAEGYIEYMNKAASNIVQTNTTAKADAPKPVKKPVVDWGTRGNNLGAPVTAPTLNGMPAMDKRSSVKVAGVADVLRRIMRAGKGFGKGFGVGFDNVVETMKGNPITPLDAGLSQSRAAMAGSLTPAALGIAGMVAAPTMLLRKREKNAAYAEGFEAACKAAGFITEDVIPTEGAAVGGALGTAAGLKVTVPLLKRLAADGTAFARTHGAQNIRATGKGKVATLVALLMPVIGGTAGGLGGHAAGRAFGEYHDLKNRRRVVVRRE